MKLPLHCLIQSCITFSLFHSHLMRNILWEDSARVLEFKAKVRDSVAQWMRAVLRNIYIKNHYIVDAPPISSNRLGSLWSTTIKTIHDGNNAECQAQIRNTGSVQQIQAGGGDRKSALQMLLGYYNKLCFNDSESFLENSLLCLTQFHSIGGKCMSPDFPDCLGW